MQDEEKLSWYIRGRYSFQLKDLFKYCIGLGAMEQPGTNLFQVVRKYQRHGKAIQKQNFASSQEANDDQTSGLIRLMSWEG